MSECQIVHIVPFDPTMQASAERLIEDGLAERWGYNDPDKNLDIRDIALSFADGAFFVAVRDDEVIATGAVLPEGDGVGRVVRMSVQRAHRRQGVGAQMLAHIESSALASGYQALVLETTADWHDAIDFYCPHGFEVEGYEDGNINLRKRLALPPAD